MRYTQYRGLAQVSNWVKLKFAAMNLEKLARWLWQEKLAPFALFLLSPIYIYSVPFPNEQFYYINSVLFLFIISHLHRQKIRQLWFLLIR